MTFVFIFSMRDGGRLLSFDTKKEAVDWIWDFYANYIVHRTEEGIEFTHSYATSFVRMIEGEAVHIPDPEK